MTTTPEATTPETVVVETTPAGTATATINREAVEAAKAEEAQQSELLAGKFKSQDDLVKAYKELEGKLGQQQPQQPATETPATETPETTTEGDTPEAEGNEAVYGKVVSDALAAAEVDASAAQAEFEKNGTLSDETFDKFAKAGFPKEVVQSYLKGVTAPAEEAKALASSQIDAIKGSVGGEESFAQLQEFIAGNFSVEEKTAYNEAVGAGDFEKALGAVNAAKLRYASEIGSEGQLLGGKNPSGDGGYASEAEMLEDMKKPEYKTSPAFRDQVTRKIAASNFHVTR